jgi:transposase
MSYILGADRNQSVMFPSTLDDYVGESNPVRAIVAFLYSLDFDEMGFGRARPAATGRPGYDPRKMMALYLWGHMNKMRSSRKLERECERNLEVMWLMEGLKPDFKTISDFRRENGDGIKQVVVKFRLWATEIGLFGRETVAIDGSKFKAVNSVDRNYTKNKLAKRIEREQEKIEKYLKEMDEVDKEEEAEGEEGKISAEELKKKIAGISKYLERDKERLKELEATGEKQISKTDADSRLMKTARGMDVCFNVQMVVDEKNKLIAEYEVTNDGNDLQQLGNMANRAKEALGVEELTVYADGGYYDAGKVKECEDAGVTVYIPITEPGTANAKGVFSQDRFKYEKDRDVYICPQGEELTRRGQEPMHGKIYDLYFTNACSECPIRAQCTTSKKKGRRIRRWEHSDVVERQEARNRMRPDAMKERKKLSEHPFGTMKRAMDAGYFLLKGKKKVSIEMGLTTLAYNMKRVINILGVEAMIGSMKMASTLAG